MCAPACKTCGEVVERKCMFATRRSRSHCGAKRPLESPLPDVLARLPFLGTVSSHWSHVYILMTQAGDNVASCIEKQD